MRSLPYLLLLMITGLHLQAQKMPSDYFEEGERYTEAKDYKHALASFQYIVKHHAKSKLYPKAYYNMGYVYFLSKNCDSAVVIFKSVLVSRFNEKENSGGGIMEDPYTNYRHWSAETLSQIYYDKKKYEMALHYFALADTVYPYLHFCGNEFSENEVRTALRYAQIYEKLNDKTKAVEALLPEVFITLADNSEALAGLRNLLKGKKELKQELDQSLQNIVSKNITNDNFIYTRYYLKFMGVDIALEGVSPAQRQSV